MALDVEAIWVDLFERLEIVEGAKTVTRRRIMEPSPEQCPAIMLLDDSGDEVATADEDGLPPLWRISGEIVIVTRSRPDVAPSTALNALIKAVRTALGNGHLQHYTNLGGKVRMLRIGRVEKGSLGENTGQAVAKLTIEMEALG